MVLEGPGHGFCIQMLPASLTGGEAPAILIIDDRMRCLARRPSTTRLHRLQAPAGATEKATRSVCHKVSRSPPVLATTLLVPEPHLRFDRLTHRGHVLEVVMIISAGFIRPACAASRIVVGRWERILTSRRSRYRQGPPRHSGVSRSTVRSRQPSYITVVRGEPPACVDDVRVPR